MDANHIDHEELSVDVAKALLKEAESLNPGPWVPHSMYVGKAAELIAQKCPGLDPKVAFSVGILHDIGRRFGVTSMRHSIDGYNFLMEKGYDLAARICLTHSFSHKDVNAVFGHWDVSPLELEFITDYISSVELNDYDLLIQLCDALALPTEFCLLEQRMIDVALRHGVNEYTVLKWKATFAIKKQFEQRMGCSIYSLLPGVVENTFA